MFSPLGVKVLNSNVSDPTWEPIQQPNNVPHYQKYFLDI